MLVTLRGQGVKEVQTVNCYAHYTLLIEALVNRLSVKVEDLDHLEWKFLCRNQQVCLMFM